MTGISRCRFETQTAAAACSAAGTSRGGMSLTEDGSFAATCPRSRTSISSMLRPATQRSIRGSSSPEPTRRGCSQNALTPGSAANPLVETGVIEGADSSAELGAEGDEKPRAARTRRAHRCQKPRLRFLHDSTPCARSSAGESRSDGFASVDLKLTELLRCLRGQMCHSAGAATLEESARRV